MVDEHGAQLLQPPPQLFRAPELPEEFAQSLSTPVPVPTRAGNGPKGAGPISPAGFAEWIARSGITLHARSYHPISDRVLVVEQDARWPQSDSPTRMATMFRVTGDRVSAALRFPDLHAALEFAHLYRALAATENA